MTVQGLNLERKTFSDLNYEIESADQISGIRV